MHVNPNMVEPVLAGIKLGESLAANPDQGILDETVALHERTTAQLATAVTGRMLPSKLQAFSQGVIAAYISATSGCETCPSLSDRHFNEECFK